MSNSIKTHIILNDLKNLGVENYTISEHVVADPTKIEVSNRELIYIHYFYSATPLEANQGVMLKSQKHAHFYSYLNVKKQDNYSESEAFHKYNSDLQVAKQGTFKFFLHYYKISY